MRLSLAFILSSWALAIALSGCTSRVEQQTPAPTVTAACPIQEGIQLPEGCAPYDAEKAMAENERYRERFDLDGDDELVISELVPSVTLSLNDLVASGETIDEKSVRTAVERTGLTGVQTLGPGVPLASSAEAVTWPVEFGAFVETGGGCVFGEVSPAGAAVKP